MTFMGGDRHARRLLAKQQKKALKKAVGGSAQKRMLPLLQTMSRMPAWQLASAAAGAAFARETSKMSGAIAAVASVGAVAERELPKAFACQVACKRGCFYCCHVLVDVSIPELARLVTHAQQNMTPGELDDLRGRSVEAAAKTRGTDPISYPFRQPCAFLSDGECSAYEARPLACRNEHSLDVDGCRYVYETGKDAPANDDHQARATGAAMCLALELAMVEAGVPPTAYELQQALAIALTVPNAFERWAVGDDVFEAALRGPGLAATAAEQA